MDSSLASKLGLQPDGSKRVAFTTADNKDTTSLGTVTTKVVLGELPVELNCHVVKTLAYPVIIGYSDLSSLKAIIDTAANTVSFPIMVPSSYLVNTTRT
ncbi:hypothetical protein G6F67_009694 [Rhizopus microsporus]|nr:hypothetical protein G6F67_009694 [Rhizopus microsporus]